MAFKSNYDILMGSASKRVDEIIKNTKRASKINIVIESSVDNIPIISYEVTEIMEDIERL